MNIESGDFPSLLRAHVELQGAILTSEELSHVGECYPRCRGKDQWDVREYASGTPFGAREWQQHPRRIPQHRAGPCERRAIGAERARV